MFLNMEGLTVAAASVSGETNRTFTGELEAFTWSAHSVDVTAVSAGEAGVLLWRTACYQTKRNSLQVKMNKNIIQ